MKALSCTSVVRLALLFQIAVVSYAQLQSSLLTDSTGAANDLFGASVAASGQLVVVGEPDKTIGSNSQQGAAILFNCPTAVSCSQGTQLVASDGAANAKFGVSVAISGSYVVVGAPGKNAAAGGLYLFSCTSSTSCNSGLVLSPTASTSGPNDNVGCSVSVFGTLVYAGAYYWNSGTGRVFVLSCPSASSCTQGSVMTDPTTSTADQYFGISTSAYNSMVLIGEGGKNSGTGMAHLFSCATYTACTHSSTLTASNGATSAAFGNTVTLYGTIAVIGAPGAGSAYVFDCTVATACTQTLIIRNTDGLVGTNFGVGVSLFGSVLAVGANGYNQFASAAGAIYVFYCSSVNSCVQENVLYSNSLVAYDQLGIQVAASSALVVGGAQFHAMGSKTNQGAAVVFSCGTGSFGLICSACGQCNSCSGLSFTSSCSSCASQWTGPYCSSCSAGYYGPACTSCSLCTHGTCYQGVSGNCSCSTGWAGVNCNQCASGYYGALCQLCNGATPYVQNSSCVSTCVNPTPYVMNFTCVTACTAPLPYLQNSFCVVNCSTPTPYLSGSTCAAQCPESTPYVQNAVCVSSCGGAQPFLQNGTCVSECYGQTPLLQGSICVSACSGNTPFVQGTGCVSSCTSPTPYVQNVTCVALCSSATPLLQGTSCVSVCNATTPYIQSSVCVASCTSLPFYQGIVCAASCNATEYPDSSNRCQNCQAPCQGCLGPGLNCTSCPSGPTPYLQGAGCVANCSGSTPVLSGSTCIPLCNGGTPYLQAGACVSNCSGATPFYQGTICAALCNTTQYADGSNRCQSCSPPCASCFGMSTNCTSCPASVTPLLQLGTCVLTCSGDTPNQQGSACIATCSAPTPFVQNNLCVTTCSGASPYAQGNTCVAACNSNQFADQSKSCQPCSSSCQCSQCSGDLYHTGNQCVNASSCPSGTFADQADHSCDACFDSNCATCTSAAQGTCTSCTSGDYLFDGGCVSSCPAGSYTSGSVCEPCASTCALCNGPSSNQCTACNSTNNLYLSGSSCVPGSNCGAATFPSASLSTCAPCDASCGTCSTAAVTCTSCAVSILYLYLGQCLVTCPAGTDAASSNGQSICQPHVATTLFYYSPLWYANTALLSVQLEIYDLGTRRRSPTLIAHLPMTRCTASPLFTIAVPSTDTQAAQLGFVVIAFNSSTSFVTDWANCTIGSYYTGVSLSSPANAIISPSACGGTVAANFDFVLNGQTVSCSPPATTAPPTAIAPSATPETSATGNTSPAGGIAGGVIGGLLLLVLLAVLLFLWRRRLAGRTKSTSHAGLVDDDAKSVDGHVAMSEVAVAPSRFGTAKPAKEFSSLDIDQATAELMKRDYRTWTRDDVGFWLSSLQVKPATIGVMASNNITGDILDEYQFEDDLQKLGVTIAGDRVKISKAIENLTGGRPPRRSSSFVSPESNVIINRKDIVVGDVLAAGHFGQVFRGTFKGAAVAIKRPATADDATREDFLDEARLMKTIPAHPNVVSYFGVCVLPNELYVVMEYCDLGSLQRFIQANAGLHASIIVNIAAQVAAGMSHLSSFIVHRDLATRNILVATSGGAIHVTARIADFGLSRPLVNDGYMRLTGRHPIPVPWTATEVLQGGVHTPAADVWSFGVVMWEMFAGCPDEPPAPNRSQVPPLVQPQRCPNAVFAVMTRCWAAAPRERPTFEILFADLTTIAQQLA